MLERVGAEAVQGFEPTDRHDMPNHPGHHSLHALAEHAGRTLHSAAHLLLAPPCCMSLLWDPGLLLTAAAAAPPARMTCKGCMQSGTKCLQ